MLDTFDKLKQQAAAGTSFIKNFKIKGVSSSDGETYEYSDSGDYDSFDDRRMSETYEYADISANENITSAEPGKESDMENLDMRSRAPEGIYTENESDVPTETEKKTDNAKTASKTNAVSAIQKVFLGMDKKLTGTMTELAELRKTTETLSRDTKSNAASASFTFERTANDIISISERLSDASRTIEDIREKIDNDIGDISALNHQLEIITQEITEMTSVLNEVSSNQQMSKNTILALASSFDDLNKKVTIGFIALGIIGGLTAIMLIAFSVM